MRPVRGTAARARVAKRLDSGGVDADDARAMLSREKRCGDAKLVRLLTRWRDAERRADVLFDAQDGVVSERAYARAADRFHRAEERADAAWCALSDYVEAVS